MIMKLLSKQPEGRYTGAHQLIDDLRALETGSPLRHATDESRATGLLADIEDRVEAREAELERVIEEGASEATRRVRRATSRSFPAHMKALLALATVAGFAVTVILAAVLFRATPTKAATPHMTLVPPAIDAPVPEPAPAPVDLTVRLAHNLKAAVLTIQMDGETTLSEPIQGTRSKLRMQGTFSRHLQIPDGKHLFTVSVQEEGGKRWSTATTRRLAVGSEATLFIEVKGLLKKTLDVTWY